MTVKLEPTSKRIVSSDESGHLLIWSKSKTNQDSFDPRELPDNIVSMASAAAAASAKIAGFVLRPTGLVVAMQKGSIEELDFFERSK